MLADVKELYASIEARASVVIKQEEDLAVHTCAIDKRECMAEEMEEKLQEREGLDDLELESLASHESNLTCCDSSLKEE
jgi:hypothetical protein